MSNSKEKKKANKLINETSPYLFQHAYNPVDWNSWSEEAFEEAKRRDKPILLSIGYSACHWCHVMEKESFENEQIAELMNKYFVNIKVDREERPDIDNIYMNFVQFTTGSGGWPLTVFLLPDKKPFYGGTYFPPEDKYGRAGFPRILHTVHDAYQNKREEILQGMDSIVESLKSYQKIKSDEGIISDDVFKNAFQNLKKIYDSLHGGFGFAPKFPSSMVLTFLLDYYYYYKDTSALKIVENTVRKMSNGGLYDHIGGGFHRYSTDAKWLIPHFEKMLYDNALLAELLSKLFMVTGNNFYRTKVEETLEFILREMQGDGGGFYSTQDADSEGEEGKYYVWEKQELDKIHDREDSEIFCNYYNVTEEGNFEGKNILHVDTDLKDYEGVRIIIERCKSKLFDERNKRIKPLTDDKVLTDWNGLMITAFCFGFRISGNIKYLDAAKNSAEFILSNMMINGRLLHSHRDGKSKINGFLEDYTNFSLGLVDLYETTSESKYLNHALNLSENILKKFYNPDDKYFYQTADNSAELILRTKDFYDNAAPSGNSSAAILFHKLGKIFEKQNYLKISSELINLFIGNIQKYPLAHGRLLSASLMQHQSSREIILIEGEDKIEFNDMKKLILKNYDQNTILIYSDGLFAKNLTHLKDKGKIGNRTTVYICENLTCKAPISTYKDLQKVLLPAQE